MSATNETMKELHRLTATKMMEMLADKDISPQMLNSIVMFLKNNNITSDPGTDEGMGELEKLLDNKKKKRFKPLTDEEKGDLSNVVSLHGGDR